MLRVRLQNGGRTCVLADLVASGGEAHVFAVPGDGGSVAKVYKDPTPERARKLAVMLANPPEDPLASRGRIAVAWPQDLLLDTTGRTVGFTMPRVIGARPIVDLYNPGTRRRVCPLFGYRYLVRTARNVAVAVGAVHAHGHIVADVREANLLVADDTLVTLVDADSFQVRDPGTGQTYRCPVGTPEYTPPELHGRDFTMVNRTERSDRFGLAVVLFELLMEGNHPFDGRYTGSGDAPPREDRVRSGWFAHGAGRCPFEPPPLAPPLALLPDRLAGMFVQCFDDGHHDPARRPAAPEWREALDAAESALVPCRANSRHHYWAHVSDCPWCARAGLLGGRDPFPSPEDVRKKRHLVPSTARARPARPQPTAPATVPRAAPRPAARPIAAPARPARRPVPADAVWSPLLALGAAASAALGAGVLVVLTLAAAALWVGGHALRRRPALAAAARSWAACGMAMALGVGGWRVIADIANRASAPGRAQTRASAPTSARWRPGAGARVGDRKTNPNDGAVAMWVPAGEFSMGSDGGASDETPVRTVHLDGFWMYRTEVTVAQYRKFCSETGSDMPVAPSWGWKDDHPVVNVSWDDAKAYADWAGVRLPTEAQWEKAARGTDGREYPWGNALDPSKAVCSVGQRNRNSTAPVGSIPSGASPYGCLDMAGNVWEWCADWYDSAYYATAPDRNPENRQESTYRVLRGGSWGSDASPSACVLRSGTTARRTTGTTTAGSVVPQDHSCPLPFGPLTLCLCRRSAPTRERSERNRANEWRSVCRTTPTA